MLIGMLISTDDPEVFFELSRGFEKLSRGKSDF